MTDDIAACPHSLAERETAVADGMCPICSADALSRLTTPQLPNDIARLIKITPEQEQYLTDGMACLLTPLQAFKLAHKPLADALRALALENAAKEGVIAFHQANEEILDKRILMLAQENERLKREEAIDADTIRVHAARIRELEAERDEAKADYLRRHKDVGDQMDRRIKAEAERDAIRAKTFEECLAEIIAAPDREEAIENIRALAQTDEVTSLQDADPELQDAVIALAQTDEGKTETGE